MKTEAKRDEYRFSRLMFILVAALEYFVALTVGGAYLAKLTAYVGMSDAMTGILTAFVSLGCSMQIVAIFFTGLRSAKKLVCAANVADQALFALVYLTPLFPIPAAHRSMLLLVLLLVAHLVMNVVHSPKINWMMALVDDDKRGVFTANKEIVSLVGGMLFTFLMGAVIDTFEARGELLSAFAFCGITIFVLMLLHTLALFLSKEKTVEKTAVRVPIRRMICNKNLLKVMLFAVLWHIAQYATTPFYGSYEVGALGFSMTFVAVLSAVCSLTRALCSRPIGRFADRHSFATMLIPCFAIWGVGYFINIFTVPANGKVLFFIYSLLNAISMGGINGGTINLIYDYVPHEQRVAALALQNSIAGVCGFLTTLAFSRLVDHIQANGNTFLGIRVYAQQVLSLFACVMILLVIGYLLLVIRKMHRVGPSES